MHTTVILGRLRCRLDRPENKSLKGIAGKLFEAKRAIDGASSKEGKYLSVMAHHPTPH